MKQVRNAMQPKSILGLWVLRAKRFHYKTVYADMGLDALAPFWIWCSNPITQSILSTMTHQNHITLHSLIILDGSRPTTKRLGLKLSKLSSRSFLLHTYNTNLLFLDLFFSILNWLYGMRRIPFCSYHPMLFKQRSIVFVLVTLTQSNLGKMEKKTGKQRAWCL